MSSLSLISLLLLLCSALDFPPGHCDGADTILDWEKNLVMDPHTNEHAEHWTAKTCKANSGKCCSADSYAAYNPIDPPFDATNNKFQDVACKFCWKTPFKPNNVQSAPAPLAGQMMCSDKKPHDLTNVEILYSYVHGVLTEKFCHFTTPQHLTATPVQGNSQSKCDHVVLPFLPGSGYNILTGMPLPLGENAVDPGYLNSPVFNPTYDDCQSTGNQDQSGYWEWTIPDHYGIESLNTLTSGARSASMHDEHSFQQQAKSSLTVSGGGKAFGVGMEFTAGSEWESASSSLSNGETVEQRYHRTAWAYKTTANPFELELHDAYLQALTSAVLSDEWTMFFLSYGTHVTTEVRIGARYTQVSKFTRKKFEEVSSNKAAYNAGIEASYDGATGKVHGETEHDKADRKMVESFVDTQFMVSTGGNGAALDASSDQSSVQYLQSAYNYPAPLSATVLPHDVLITQNKFWKVFQDNLKADSDENAKEVTKEDFQNKWLAAINAYCGDEAHKCQQASSLDKPEPMSLTNMVSTSEIYGNTNGNWHGKAVVTFKDMPKFQDYKPLIKISKIRTYCSKHNGRGRVRGIQFEYFDGDRSVSTDILGTQGNSDSDAGASWDDDSNTINFDEFISVMTISSGDDVDGIWFTVQNWKDSTTRKIGCGYTSPNMKSWNIQSDNKLLGFSGTKVDMDGATTVKQIQFESFLYIVPTMTANGPQCSCYTANAGTSGQNGAKCTDGAFLWCGSDDYCTNGNVFAKDQFDAQCNKNPSVQSANTPTSLKSAPSVASHHEKLLQQIAYKKSLRKGAAAAGSGKPSVSAAPSKAKKHSAHHHTKWDDVKENFKHTVEEMSKDAKHNLKHSLDSLEEMSKKIKADMKAELKDLLVKELKEALGHLQQKQTHLESTVTRMLMHEVESF